MSTIFDILSPESRCAASIWASISDAVSEREKPLLPVAQKVQPILQPTCVDMQTDVPWR